MWPPPVLGYLLLVAFVAWQPRTRAPMLALALFSSRNFRVGNTATLRFYAALSAVTFFLVVFLQQVAGHSPLDAGLALMRMSVLTILLAKRFGALADRLGPRRFMGVGPPIAGGGLPQLARLGAHASCASGVLPGVTLSALGCR